MNYLLDYAPKGEEYKRTVQQQRLIIKVAKTVWSEMKRQGKTLQDIADKLDKTVPAISRLINGDRNITLKNLSELAYSLGMEVEINLSPLNVDKSTSKAVKLNKCQTKPKLAEVMFEVVGAVESQQSLHMPIFNSKAVTFDRTRNYEQVVLN